jgi:hypothetical protein
MFEAEREAASRQLALRDVRFKVYHGHYSADKLVDKHTLTLAGFKKTSGDAAWFNSLIDGEEFRKHFDSHTLIDWDDIAPNDTPSLSPVAQRVARAFGL